MNNIPKNPFKNLVLDEEEKEIFEAVEAGRVKIHPISSKLKKYYQQIAKNTLAKNKNINIRLSEGDLFKLKSKAIEEGLPYQTLAASIIHKYTQGRFS